MGLHIVTISDMKLSAAAEDVILAWKTGLPEGDKAFGEGEFNAQ